MEKILTNKKQSGTRRDPRSLEAIRNHLNYKTPKAQLDKNQRENKIKGTIRLLIKKKTQLKTLSHNPAPGALPKR